MIYFDAGATTLEKPESVRAAVAEAVATMCSPGRGGYPATKKAEETAFACRNEAAELFGVDSPEKVIFTSNATHGLNIAIHSLVKPGSRVVISGYEHNSVLRTLYAIDGVELTVVDSPLFDPQQALEEFRQVLRRGVDVVVCTHVSNVFGYVLPVEELAKECRHSGVPLIVDASQSAGVLPVRMDVLQPAFIAMPGHKGLYGPQGTGLLLCGEWPTLPLLSGGTGSVSRLRRMPDDLPDRLEAGTHNMPGIAGLLEGLRFIRRTGLQQIARQEREVVSAAAEYLRKIPQVHLYADENFANQTGVLSFTVDGMDCETVGALLAEKGIAVRAGLHCSPLAHQTAGTGENGTVRLSVSAFNTTKQAEIFAGELRKIIGENVRF